MAILYLEGFDNLDSTGANLRLLAGASYDARVGRRNGGAIGVANGDNCSFPAASGSTTILLGAAIKPSLLVTSELRFNNLAGTAVSTVFTTSGTIAVYRGAPSANLLGTTSTVWTTSDFKYIEIKVVNHATTGSVEIYSNGVSVINLTNVNTAGAAGNFTSVQFSAAAGNATLHYMDDVYITDAADGFWGDTQILSVLPKANGANTGWTASGSGWSDINDVIPSGAGSITSSTANQKSTFDVGILADLGRISTSSVSATSGGAAANLTDYDMTNYNQFNGNSSNQFATIDFGSNKDLAFYKVSQSNAVAGSYLCAFKVQTSTDNSTWTDYTSYAQSTTDTGIVAISASARYFRVAATATTNGAGWRLLDVQVYGYEDISTAKTIKAVQMTLDMSTNTGSATIQPIARIGGTDYTMGNSMTVASGAQGPGKSLATVSPATSAAFTATEINGAEFGVRFEG